MSMTDRSPEYAPTEVPTSVAMRILECSDETLRNWRCRGVIRPERQQWGVTSGMCESTSCALSAAAPMRDERADAPGAANTIVRMFKLLLNFAFAGLRFCATPSREHQRVATG